MQFAWDATSLDSAQRCMRYYYYTMIRGVKKKETNVHLLFGGIYASALEQFYKLRAKGATIEEALRVIVKEAMVASWDKENDKPYQFDHAAKTRPNLIRTIIWYIEEFGEEDDSGFTTYHKQNGEPAVELSFAIELSDDIVYCGHLDRVVQMAGKSYVMDQKTTGGTIGPYYFDTFNPNNQMSGYALAGQMILQTPVKGVVIDAAQIAVNFTRFERGVTLRTKDQLEEWLDNTIKFINKAREWTRAEYFPMNPNNCGNYGGCPFRIVCSRSPSLRDNFLKSDFTEHFWDPLKER